MWHIILLTISFPVAMVEGYLALWSPGIPRFAAMANHSTVYVISSLFGKNKLINSFVAGWDGIF